MTTKEDTPENVTVSEPSEISTALTVSNLPGNIATKDYTQRRVSKEKAEELAKKINLQDSQSIISFGIDAQKQVTQISESMLSHVRNKDTGPISEALTTMVSQMRGLDFDSIKPGEKPGFLSRILRRANPLIRFMQKYETVEGQLQATTNKLEKDKLALSRKVVMMDKLYLATIDHLYSLDEFIAALEHKISQVSNTIIPELQARAELTKDMADSQAVSDMVNTRNRLERRLDALLLTRAEAINSLPSIRSVQSLDTDLIERIQTQIVTAVPIWTRRIALNISIWQTAEIGRTTKAATDFTNEIIAESSKQLKESNRKVRQEIERGIIDVDVLKQATEDLIDTINESIDITEEGRKRREETAAVLQQTETRLKQALIAAADRQNQITAN